jgi:hypothetical protein
MRHNVTQIQFKHILTFAFQSLQDENRTAILKQDYERECKSENKDKSIKHATKENI